MTGKLGQRRVKDSVQGHQGQENSYAARLGLNRFTDIVMSQRRVTLKDVAQAAGVATGTVSMVLNDSPLISASTKAHVRQVLKELGYVYNQAASNLRNKRSRIVGVSICDLLNPYYADVTAGIQAALEELGRVIVLGNCAESLSRQLRFLETLREYNVEGVLLTPAVGTPKANIEQVMGWGLPVVQVSRYVPGVHTDYVGNDNRQATEVSTNYLISLGHEQLAYIGLNRQTSTGRDRFAGFRSAMKSSRQPIKEQWIIECQATREDGFKSIVALFKAADPPSGVVCFNDALAFGAMLGLRQLGLEPGRDCSVVGMDDVAEAALWNPSLTTVAVDRNELGQVAGRLLFNRIADIDRPVEHVVLKPQLVVRDSCGPPSEAISPSRKSGPSQGRK